MNTVASFWAKVKQGKPDECWPWTKGLDKDRYGHTSWQSKQYQAHRLAYRFFFGAFDERLSVLHKCDNPSCCNPDHLFLGTHLDNMQDMIKKGRQRKLFGEEHPKCVKAEIKKNKIIEITKLYATKQYTQVALAKKFSLSISYVGRIVRRNHWVFRNEITL